MNIDKRENYNPGDAYSQEQANQYKENDIDSGPLDNAFNEEEENRDSTFNERGDFEDDALDIEEDEIEEEDPLEDADDFEEEEDFEDDELEEDELEEEDETTENDDFNENDLNVDDPQNPRIF